MIVNTYGPSIIDRNLRVKLSQEWPGIQIFGETELDALQNVCCAFTLVVYIVDQQKGRKCTKYHQDVRDEANHILYVVEF